MMRNGCLRPGGSSSLTKREGTVFLGISGGGSFVGKEVVGARVAPWPASLGRGTYSRRINYQIR